ncbi:MAG: Dam family site-specific DNA-(adenine-N6)-methyltransferase [Pseudomonas sp.]|uniref:DNA adenine methylase n=1 Tax=Pseudomonas sp. TaxID=306 RepID=UPI00264769C7|nr:Dam family site-specific DNA-(adenine-N6)-methyltransferase [Pseudomonas sp.]MDN5390885.1 Dam family site-specific DNA-(adenine-N6)-methyltransferase [Pseudomonas sp.]MDN5406143.1 Dam family site-specific DNA-(adenine-N6)-methyltransferase [Pseudomonas sp.]MDN5448843.1 Dam family site-specific DNA-(adenine-N6)-methyltransferase [Pseudomonas sp.]MDN5454075.1 Dam family site-specific DNA-(adenine-N6)-methyltransferase [Pseudomonas sp.]MDN5456938.1 Dam family site-specific DNA-(adenine-N6)-met
MEPLFRWAGSKKKLLPSIKSRFPSAYGTYHEPFCGSACLFFDVLPRSAVLSDRNEELMMAYREIQKSPEDVYGFLGSYEISKDKYYELRALDVSTLSSPARAARFIYLNKLCFNGVYRTNKLGLFNVPMGTKTGKMPTLDVLARFSDALQGVKLVGGDFSEISENIKSGDLVYLDPPYSKPESRERGEYGPGSFHFSDIERLVSFLDYINSIGAFFIFSYSDCEIIRKNLREEWNTDVVSVRRHVAGFSAHRKVVDELIVSNFSI